MPLNGNGVEIVAKKEHKFTFNTPHGPHSFMVPAEEMKCCPCGCELFDVAYRLCYVRPGNSVGVDPVCCRVEVYLCKECSREIGPMDPSVKEAAARKIVVADVME